MVFVQKRPFYQLFFLGNIGQENVFYDILEQKNAFLGYKNKKLKKSKNWHFSKGVNPWFWSKNGHFANFFFWQYRPGKCLLRYPRTKKRLSGYKNKNLKKSKNRHFSNFFFLGNIQQEKVFYDILERKKAFLGLKNKKFKKSKIWHFSKAVNPWFWSKNGHYSNFSFYSIKARKISFTIF